MNKFMRTLLAASALSIAAIPLAEAAPNYPGQQHGYHHSQPKKPQPSWAKKQRHHWKKGERVSDWRKRGPVRDYHRYNLPRPGRGQQWVKVDNDYLLIGIATGLIAGIIAGQ